MVLPSGFGLPPLPYLLALLLAVGGVVWGLWRARPEVSEGTVLASAPWMVVGSALHALYQLDAAPTVVRPLLGTPAVYLTTVTLGGAVWLLAVRTEDPTRPLAIAGFAVLLPAIGAVIAAGTTLRPGWVIASLAASAIIAAIGWLALRELDASATSVTGRAGLLVLFAHALDGVATAVGVDVFGFVERTPASRLVMEFAAGLPTAELLGVGWLFVVVKAVLATLVVWLFADFVREEPARAYLLLAFVAAVGLGPGAQNLLLFMVR